MPGHFLLKNTPREFVKAVVFLLWFYDLTIKTGLITWLSCFSRVKRPVGDSDGARSHNLVIDSHAHSQLCYGAIYKKELARLKLHKVFVFP